MLLNIPPQKTLLRRHLTTNFNVLIGPETQQEKRDITESTAYTPLTTTAKVRVCAALENEILQNLSLTLLFLIRKTWNTPMWGEICSRSSAMLFFKAFNL